MMADVVTKNVANDELCWIALDGSKRNAPGSSELPRDPDLGLESAEAIQIDGALLQNVNQ